MGQAQASVPLTACHLTSLHLQKICSYMQRVFVFVSHALRGNWPHTEGKVDDSINNSPPAKSLGSEYHGGRAPMRLLPPAETLLYLTDGRCPVGVRGAQRHTCCHGREKHVSRSPSAPRISRSCGRDSFSMPHRVRLNQKGHTHVRTSIFINLTVVRKLT